MGESGQSNQWSEKLKTCEFYHLLTLNLDRSVYDIPSLYVSLQKILIVITK